MTSLGPSAVTKNVTLVAFLILLLVLTVTEYKPDTIEELSVNGQGGASVHAGDTLSVLTWNTGYGALGNNADFFMDGGSMVNTADEDRVQENMAAINDEIAGLDPDVVFLQEVDRNSKRSHGIDELDGVISMVAALLAERIVPGTKDYLIPSHKGKEPAMGRLAKELNVEPVIDANMALGE